MARSTASYARVVGDADWPCTRLDQSPSPECFVICNWYLLLAFTSGARLRYGQWWRVPLLSDGACAGGQRIGIGPWRRALNGVSRERGDVGKERAMPGT